MIKKILEFLFFVVVLCGMAFGAFILYLFTASKFDIDKLRKYDPQLTTQIFDRNDKLVANVFDKENRVYVKFEEIPTKVIETLVSTEDTSFFEHQGFNIEAIIRALIKDIKAGKKVEGASTITQQLVKMIYLDRRKSIQRKLKELFIAIKVDHILSKEKILEIYLNQVYLGHSYYGIKTASKGYFHKELDELNLKEIAMLIALPKAPSAYNPTRHYSKNIARANVILKRMYSIGWITKQTYQTMISTRPVVYNSTLTQNKAPYIVDMAIKELKKTYPDIKYGGYDVKLSVDLDIQKIATKSLQDGYENLKKKYKLTSESLNGAMVTLDSKTGDILSAVGGVDYKKSSFNRVTQALRSVGSSIKPFMYQIALDKGYNPASKIPDVSRTFIAGKGKFYRPKNYERNTLGFTNFRTALVHSRNLATINLATLLGLDVVYKGFSDYGFSGFPRDLSIVLGSFAQTPLKMAEQYTMFSNYGVKVKPRLILSVVNKHRNLKVDFQTQSTKLLSPPQAYLMISILKDVVKRGTGSKTRMKSIQVAGKTGTTNEFRDAWWCGFTPDTTTVIWYGNDNNTPFGKHISGGLASAPVFKDFYTKFLKLHPERKRRFDVPKGIKTFNNNGEKELFTTTSPPPQIETIVDDPIF